jgi:hypothetical protein
MTGYKLELGDLAGFGAFDPLAVLVFSLQSVFFHAVSKRVAA